MNILFFLTPKNEVAYIHDTDSLRQALEKMESAGYAAIPILNHRGEYRGTLTEGDLLWAMKNMCYMDMRQAEARREAPCITCTRPLRPRRLPGPSAP
ncbi:MAG: CBS domain-containing protein [Sutterella sp.]|nr:CBS domain-containing protein [Sutterella sp.]